MLLPTRADAVYTDVRRPIEQRLGPANMEGLARVDLQRFGDEVGVDDVYRLHQIRIDPIKHDESKVEQRIRDHALRGNHYLRLVEPEHEPDQTSRDRLEFLRNWGAQTTFPLLVHLCDLREPGRCSIEESRQALVYIESFIVRRLFTGVSSRPLNRIFIQVIRQMDPAETVPTLCGGCCLKSACIGLPTMAPRRHSPPKLSTSRAGIVQAWGAAYIPGMRAVNKEVGATFKLTMVGGGDYASKINTVIASSDLAGFIYNANTTPNLANYSTYSWRTGVVDGRIYCVPASRAPFGTAFAYRADILSQAGVMAPTLQRMRTSSNGS